MKHTIKIEMNENDVKEFLKEGELNYFKEAVSSILIEEIREKLFDKTAKIHCHVETHLDNGFLVTVEAVEEWVNL